MQQPNQAQPGQPVLQFGLEPAWRQARRIRDDSLVPLWIASYPFIVGVPTCFGINHTFPGIGKLKRPWGEQMDWRQWRVVGANVKMSIQITNNDFLRVY
jgi:hypothetical protein